MRTSKLASVTIFTVLGAAAACGGHAVIGSESAGPAASASAGGVNVDAGQNSVDPPLVGPAELGAGGHPFVGNDAPEQGGAPTLDPATAGSPAIDATAGAAPGADIDACQNATWVATASVTCQPDGSDCAGWAAGPQGPAQAIDGNFNTRYTTGQAQAGGEELAVAFPAMVTISGVRLVTPWQLDNPARYALEYSTDGVTFQPFDPPIAQAPAPAATPIEPRGLELHIPLLPPTAMRALKVTQTGTKTTGWWSVLELMVDDCTPY